MYDKNDQPLEWPPDFYCKEPQLINSELYPFNDVTHIKIYSLEKIDQSMPKFTIAFFKLLITIQPFMTTHPEVTVYIVT